MSLHRKREPESQHRQNVIVLSSDSDDGAASQPSVRRQVWGHLDGTARLLAYRATSTERSLHLFPANRFDPCCILKDVCRLKVAHESLLLSLQTAHPSMPQAQPARPAAGMLRMLLQSGWSTCSSPKIWLSSQSQIDECKTRHAEWDGKPVNCRQPFAATAPLAAADGDAGVQQGASATAAVAGGTSAASPAAAAGGAATRGAAPWWQ